MLELIKANKLPEVTADLSGKIESQVQKSCQETGGRLLIPDAGNCLR
jgi:hypothetical protein